VVGNQNQYALICELAFENAERIAYFVIRKELPEWGSCFGLYHPFTLAPHCVRCSAGVRFHNPLSNTAKRREPAIHWHDDSRHKSGCG